MLSEVVVLTPSDRVSPNLAISAYTMTKALRFIAVQCCVPNAENYRKPIEHRIFRNSSSATVFLHQSQPISCRAHQRQNGGHNPVAAIDCVSKLDRLGDLGSWLCSPAFCQSGRALRVYPIVGVVVKDFRTSHDLGRPKFIPFLSKGRDLSKARQRRGGSLRFGFDWG
jgi:hypothetical protein